MNGHDVAPPDRESADLDDEIRCCFVNSWGSRFRHEVTLAASIELTWLVDLARMRREYETRGLDETDVDDDPLVQFDQWLSEAIEAGVTEPNAMVLSTVGPTGAPSGRHVLLKGVSAGGFEFYTNYESRKGRDLVQNDSVALTFPWLELHRQVCISGRAEQLSESASDAYFAVRPRDAAIGAWASAQSSVIGSRGVLDDRVAETSARFPDEVPRPPHWGGYRVTPSSIEFWQGRPSRLHDRIVFDRDGDDGWTRSRLSP